MQQKYAGKQDITDRKTAYYRTGKAVAEYRDKSFAFDRLFIKDEQKARLLMNSSIREVTEKNKAFLYIIVVAWLLLLIGALYSCPAVARERIRFSLLPETEQGFTGHLERAVDFIKVFGWAEWGVVLISFSLIIFISILYAKWMMKKITLRIEASL